MEKVMTLRTVRFGAKAILGLLVTALVAALAYWAVTPAFGQGPDGGPDLGDDVKPSPPSIGADIPLSYFGAPPSVVQKELIGPFQLLKSGVVDEDKGTITLPLYRGQLQNGRSVWFILTDTTDKDNAEALGINHSAKLHYATVGGATRTARLEPDASLTFFGGAVDFSPEHVVVPGEDLENPFPPQEFQPGSVGDSIYTPLVHIENAGGHVYNAPVIAFDVDEEEITFCDEDDPPVDYSLVHDKVVGICPDGNGGGTVTLQLTPGFSFARPVLYLSTDASVDLAAALEGATYVPALAEIRVGRDDSAFSGVERIFAFINGPVNHDPNGSINPQRQGFNSALRGEGSPLNVLGGIPTVATDYSPLWDLNAGQWTQEAIELGYRSRLTEEFAILGFVERGWLTGPGGAPYGSVGMIINCLIVMRLL
jgi:hypothetical protein